MTGAQARCCTAYKPGSLPSGRTAEPAFVHHPAPRCRSYRAPALGYASSPARRSARAHQCARSQCCKSPRRCRPAGLRAWVRSRKARSHVVEGRAVAGRRWPEHLAVIPKADRAIRRPPPSRHAAGRRRTDGDHLVEFRCELAPGDQEAKARWRERRFPPLPEGDRFIPLPED
jgi:hypothetical protein